MLVLIYLRQQFSRQYKQCTLDEEEAHLREEDISEWVAFPRIFECPQGEEAERHDGKDESESLYVEGDGTSLSVPDLEPGIAYKFRIRAWNDFGWSPFSDPSKIYVSPTAAPGRPTVAKLISSTVCDRETGERRMGLKDRPSQKHAQLICNRLTAILCHRGSC